MITRETMTEIRSGDETVPDAGAETDAGGAGAGAPVEVRLVPQWTPGLGDAPISFVKGRVG